MGAKAATEARAPEIEELCVDYRRVGMSFRTIAKVVTEKMRERYLVAHLKDVDIAKDQGREPIPANQDFVISHEGCRQAFKRGMKRIAGRSAEAAHEIRSLELDRLDELQKALWPKATGQHVDDKGKPLLDPNGRPIKRDADVPAAMAILRIMEHRRALTGIGASELGAIGEQGAEVKFSTYTPAEIAKKKKEIEGGKQSEPKEEPDEGEDEAAP